MKVADLKKILIEEKDNKNVVVLLHKKDIEKINKIAESGADYLILNLRIDGKKDGKEGKELISNNFPLFVAGATFDRNCIPKLIERLKKRD